MRVISYAALELHSVNEALHLFLLLIFHWVQYMDFVSVKKFPKNQRRKECGH